MDVKQQSVAVVNSTCPQCCTRFVCDLAAGKSQCWCFHLPPALPVTSDAGCLCPACLTQAIEQARRLRQVPR